jgi:PPP family 3-phenylpropionic acid transporter
VRVAVAAAYFALLASGGAFIPYFPLYLSQLGLTGAEIGLVLSLNPGVRWSGAVLWAYVADRWRVRYLVLVGAAATSTLLLATLPFADGFAEVIAVTTAIAFLAAPLMPLLDATVVDHLKQLGGDYGRIRAWGSIGFIAGALGSAAVLARSGPWIVPWLLFAFQVLLPFAVLRLPREQFGHPEQFRAPWRLLSPPLAAFLASSFLLNLSSGAWAGFFAAYSQSRGFPDTVPGIAWGLAVASEVVVLYFGRRLLTAFSAPDLMLVVLAITTVRYLLTSVVTEAWAAVVLQLGYGLGYAGFHLSAQLLLARLVPPRSSTNGQALYGFVSFGLGGSLGFALAGALVDRLGPERLFAFEAAISALAIVPALALRRLLRAA